MNIKKTIAQTLLTGCLIAGACHAQPVATTVAPQDDAQKAPQPTYCPLATDLVKHGMYWYAEKRWRSYSESSFVNQISQFIGAQWIGVNVGEVICLYQGAESLTFPVSLQTIHPMSVETPTGEIWINLKYGYKKCVSNNVTDCPFYLQQKQKPITNLYQGIQFHPPTPKDQNQE